MEISSPLSLEVIWVRNAHLKHKEFPLEKAEQAFNWYWRINGDLVVLRDQNWMAKGTFSEGDVPEHIRWHPTKEGYREVFEQWLKEKLSEQGHSKTGMEIVA